MTNLEKIIELSKSKGFESLENECIFLEHECEDCSFYKVMGHNRCGCWNCAEQLLEKYIEPKKLTKRERGFLEYAQSGWIVRDKYGLKFYSIKPYKDEDYKYWSSEPCPSFEMVKELFPFIKWEHEKPYSVEELLKWEVEE